MLGLLTKKGTNAIQKYACQPAQEKEKNVIVYSDSVLHESGQSNLCHNHKTAWKCLKEHHIYVKKILHNCKTGLFKTRIIPSTFISMKRTTNIHRYQLQPRKPYGESKRIITKKDIFARALKCVEICPMNTQRNSILQKIHQI